MNSRDTSEHRRPGAILIAGPTASGKSSLALELAEQVDGEIINTDSMQVYPVLNVLTARPPREDLQRVPHHLYGTVPPHVSWSAALWLEQARRMRDEIASRGKIPIFVGGTGLYFRALEHGLVTVPEISPQVRADVRGRLETLGSEAVHSELVAHDPEGAALLKPGDSHRVARALEVVLSTGTPLHVFHQRPTDNALLDGLHCRRLLLLPDRSVLHDRINARATIMLEQGAIEEVRQLLSMDLPSQATALKAIGVPQIKGFLAGEIDETMLVERLQAATRQYAKRQMTWFKNQFGPDWQRIV